MKEKKIFVRKQKKHNCRQPKIKEVDGRKVAFCPDCDDYIPIEAFGEWYRRGIPTYCIVHHNARQAKLNPDYYKKNKEKIMAQQKKYKQRLREEKNEKKKSQETQGTITHDHS